MKTKQKIVIIIIICIAIIAIGGVYLNKRVKSIQPSDKPVEIGKVMLDMSHPLAKKYKTIFTQEFEMPANLDGRFRVVAIGCGTSCMYLYALDKTSGKIYEVKSPSNEPFSDFTLEENHIKVKNQAGQELSYGYYPAGDMFVEFVM